MNPEDFTTLIEMLVHRANKSAEISAFNYVGKAVTFGEMWDAINRFAVYLLENGLQFGERVVVAIPNCAEFFFVFL